MQSFREKPTYKEPKDNTVMQQAFNIFLGYLITTLSSAIALSVLVYYMQGIFIFPLLGVVSVCFAMYKGGRALIVYTLQEREDTNIIEETVFNEGITQIPQVEGVVTYFPKPRNKGYYQLTVKITELQRFNVAKTLLSTNSLPVNYIESLGINRQNAEKLRAELANYELIKFNKNGRVSLTGDGKKSCQKILKQQKKD